MRGSGAAQRQRVQHTACSPGRVVCRVAAACAAGQHGTAGTWALRVGKCHVEKLHFAVHLQRHGALLLGRQRKQRKFRQECRAWQLCCPDISANTHVSLYTTWRPTGMQPRPCHQHGSMQPQLASLEASILGWRSMIVKTRCVAALPLATSAAGERVPGSAFKMGQHACVTMTLPGKHRSRPREGNEERHSWHSRFKP